MGIGDHSAHAWLRNVGSGSGEEVQALTDDCRRTNLFVPPALAHESTWATMSITTFLRSAISFQVRKRIAVFLREPLPDDFIPPLPQAALASGDVDDVAHDELISTPST